jgi:hypothetical protein
MFETIIMVANGKNDFEMSKYVAFLNAENMRFELNVASTIKLESTTWSL